MAKSRERAINETRERVRTLPFRFEYARDFFRLQSTILRWSIGVNLVLVLVNLVLTETHGDGSILASVLNGDIVPLDVAATARALAVGVP